MSAYSVAQSLSAPLLGRLSDRYGRRPLVLVALAGSAVSLALTGAASSLGWLVACRALAGAFGGSISVAQAYLADTVPEERRTGAMAQMGDGHRPGARRGRAQALPYVAGAGLAGLATVAVLPAGGADRLLAHEEGV